MLLSACVPTCMQYTYSILTCIHTYIRGGCKSLPLVCNLWLPLVTYYNVDLQAQGQLSHNSLEDQWCRYGLTQLGIISHNSLAPQTVKQSPPDPSDVATLCLSGDELGKYGWVQSFACLQDAFRGTYSKYLLC